MKTLLISLVVAAVAGVSASYAAPAKKAEPVAAASQPAASSNDSGSGSEWQLKKSPRAHHKGQYANSISLN
ncbi:hypothetical protein [Rhizobium sp.]|jgi:hypothetical protein|uniref:hypothetical protein n=1 Tax=Rhizobium sp. TaxID=391 RepID=UPI000E909FEC|nr:hypothetical protein [Rhizobium sp.]